MYSLTLLNDKAYFYVSAIVIVKYPNWSVMLIMYVIANVTFIPIDIIYYDFIKKKYVVKRSIINNQ